jgi:hypothetical protein
MCLTLDWFDASRERSAQRNRDGVSPQEAKDALWTYGSSVWPIAVEMAEWLYKNWTVEQFLMLDTHSRDLLLRIVSERIQPNNALQATCEDARA